MAKRVLIIGWDAADWQLINPLLDRGELPHLARLVNEGCIGNLATLSPCLSPLLWTTVATGRTADQHGILSFLEPLASGTGAQLARSTSRRVKALWNIAAQTNRRAIVANWYASHPAEPIPGVVISNEAYKCPTSLDYSAWPLVSGAIHPPDLAETLASLRLHPGELAPADLAPLIPRIAELDLLSDRRPSQLAEILARNLSVHSLFTAALENEAWDLAAVFFDAIDTAGHLFMPYHPPRLPQIDPRDFEFYQHVMNGLYQLHDQMLGRLLELAGPETHVVLLSDHGFQSGPDRPTSIQQSDAPEAEAAEWHRQYGVVVLHGPLVRRDERVYGATLLDIAPTVLTLLGLPAGEDMPGKVLTSALTTDVIPPRIPSWEEVAGPSGQHPALGSWAPVTATAEVAQLVNLGYLPATAGGGSELAALVSREQQFNLAAVHLHHGRPAEARPIFEQLSQSHPNQPRFLEPLATCWQHLRRPEKCLEVLEQLQELNHRSVNGYLLAASCFGQLGDHSQALAAYQLAAKLEPGSALVPLLQGEYLITEGRGEDAVAQLELAVNRDPESPRGWESLARARLVQQRPREAESAAREAIARRYFSPLAHYCLGLALAKQDRFREAIPAMQTAVAQHPQLSEAHQQLAQLYQRLGNPGLASVHMELAAERPDSEPVAQSRVESRSAAAKPNVPKPATGFGEPIVIVTGLPRSGTSLAMQLVAAAGVPLVVDEHRPADASNPAGYFEFAPVLNLAQDAAWLDRAPGKAVKVLYPLVLDLPRGRPYRVIIVDRDLDEVLDSQAAMLDRNQQPSHDRSTLREAWSNKLTEAWTHLSARGDCQLLRLEHRALIEGNVSTLSRLIEFLKSSATLQDLTAVIRPELYRSRS